MKVSIQYPNIFLPSFLNLKNPFLEVLLILILGLLSTNCHKKKDDSQKNTLMLLGLYIANQQSGNCAEVTKYAGNPAYYLATLTPIPKGGCNVGTFYGGTTSSAIKSKVQSDFNSYISLIDSEFGSSCATTKAGIQTTLNTESSLNIWVDTYLEFARNSKFYSIGNLIQGGKNLLINIFPTDEIASEADLNTLSSVSLDEFKKYNNYASISLLAQTANNTSCATAVSSKISTTFLSDKYSTGGSGYKKNTKLFSAYCYYEASTLVTNNNRCATLNEKF